MRFLPQRCAWRRLPETSRVLVAVARALAGAVQQLEVVGFRLNVVRPDRANREADQRGEAHPRLLGLRQQRAEVGHAIRAAASASTVRLEQTVSAGGPSASVCISAGASVSVAAVVEAELLLTPPQPRRENENRRKDCERNAHGVTLFPLDLGAKG
jgi:hypothetical protein